MIKGNFGEIGGDVSDAPQPLPDYRAFRDAATRQAQNGAGFRGKTVQSGRSAACFNAA
jgi:hypothetical protein